MPLNAPYIIAEIGQNHQGDVYTAIRLVAAAMQSGADAVKFQYRDFVKEYSQEELLRPHPRPEDAFGNTYGEHRGYLDLSLEELTHIKRRIEYNLWPIDFGVTPCHVDLVEPLQDLELDFWKIASKDHDKPELYHKVQEVAETPVICSLPDGYFAQGHQLDCDHILHCVPKYPTPVSEANVWRVEDNPSVDGWSDHTGTPYLGAAACALGAQVFEAHITFSQHQKGTDHLASLTPKMFRHWAASIRATHRAMSREAKTATL
jgi:sialic acid synthase SpsE